MKALLTSNGLTNPSIVRAFEELVGKPLSETSIVYIPTAANLEEGDKSWLINDINRFRELGPKQLDVVDIAAEPRTWEEPVNNADSIVVGGGNTFYLSYWMQRSGLFDKLPDLLKTKVYVGISAGSVMLTDSMRVTSQALERGETSVDDELDKLGPHGESSSKTVRLLPLVIRPHLNAEFRKNITIESVGKLATKFNVPVYALDDQSALRVVDDRIDVISEGVWKKFN